MPNSAEELGYPAWLNAFAVFIVGGIGAALIYGLAAFIANDATPAHWTEFGRVVFVVFELGFLAAVIHAAGEE